MLSLLNNHKNKHFAPQFFEIQSINQENEDILQILFLYSNLDIESLLFFLFPLSSSKSLLLIDINGQLGTSAQELAKNVKNKYYQVY